MSNETIDDIPGAKFFTGLDPELIPQDPFYPQQEIIGPAFLDTEACLCQLQPRPDLDLTSDDKLDKGQSDQDAILWQCAGNQTAASHELTTGKWFRTQKGDGGIKTLDDLVKIPIYDASNPPKLDQQFRWNNATKKLIGTREGFSVWDKACTGVNRTSFSTSYYRATEQIKKDETPVDAAPCWRPGAIPLQIQNVTDWENTGCAEGFLCKSIQSLSRHETDHIPNRRQQHRQLTPAILPPNHRMPNIPAERQSLPGQ